MCEKRGVGDSIGVSQLFVSVPRVAQPLARLMEMSSDGDVVLTINCLKSSKGWLDWRQDEWRQSSDHYMSYSMGVRSLVCEMGGPDPSRAPYWGSVAQEPRMGV